MTPTRAMMCFTAASPILIQYVVPTLRRFAFSRFTLRSYAVSELLFPTWARAALGLYIIYKAEVVETIFGRQKYQRLLLTASAYGLGLEALLSLVLHCLKLNITYGTGPLILLSAMTAIYMSVVPAQSYFSLGSNIRFSNKWWVYAALLFSMTSSGDFLRVICGALAVCFV